MIYDVVLLAHDEDIEQFSEALQAIKNQSIKPQNIIVVSHKSKYSNHNQDFLQQNEGGIGKAREIGYKKASTDWILFTDADTILPKNFVESSLTFARKKDLDAVGGMIQKVGSTPLGYLFAGMSNIANFGKGHSTLIKSDIDFSKVQNDRGEDFDIWRQAFKGDMLLKPRVATNITRNHKTVAFILILLVLYLLYK